MAFFNNAKKGIIAVFAKKNAVLLCLYQQVWKVLGFYNIGKLGFQNPCFESHSREIHDYKPHLAKSARGKSLNSQSIEDTDFPDHASERTASKLCISIKNSHKRQ